MNQIGLLDSQVIRAALVALVGLLGLILSFFGVGEAAFSEKALKLVDAALLLITTGSVLWAAHARATKPTPPITDGAVAKTEAMTLKQGGYARPAMLAVLLVAATFAGCVGTKAAFEEAARSPDAAADTAYVIAEQYSATLDQALAIVANPATPPAVKAAIKQAELAATPVVLSLHGLRDSYVAVKSADNAAALQKAVNDAVLKVAALIRTIKSPVRTP